MRSCLRSETECQSGSILQGHCSRLLRAIVDLEPQDIGNFFPEFFAVKQNCKFHNCLHLEEPKCAVKQGVEAETLSTSRYRSYVQMLQDEEGNYRQDIHQGS